MIRLSIIIPVYNVEKYVVQCLDSVFNQDLHEDEYEVICVNDGSTDSSREIVAGYLPLHRNMRLLDHPCNMKLGVARNTGRKAARGTYIWHVDSDDMVAPDCFRSIVEICEENELDVLEFGFIYRWNNGLLESNAVHQLQRDNQIYTGANYLEKYYINDIGGICSIWRKVYSRSFLENNKLFSPPINMGEDEPFAIGVFALAKRMKYYDRDCYIYSRNESSLTGVQKRHWNAAKWYEVSLGCPFYMDKVYQLFKAHYSHTVCKHIENMIRCDILYWRTFDIPHTARVEYWKICRNHFWKNRFVFKYLSRKCIWLYMKNIMKTIVTVYTIFCLFVWQSP